MDFVACSLNAKWTSFYMMMPFISRASFTCAFLQGKIICQMTVADITFPHAVLRFTVWAEFREARKKCGQFSASE